MHVKRKCTHALLRRYERLAIEGIRKGKGRSKKFLGEVIRQDMTQLQFIEDKTLDKKICRSRIRVKS